jgi:hypothetical protein
VVNFGIEGAMSANHQIDIAQLRLKDAHGFSQAMRKH